MKSLVTLATTYLLAGGCYVLAFLMSGGSTLDAYLLTLALLACATLLARSILACATLFARLILRTALDERVADSCREWMGIAAFVALALYLGLSTSVPVPPLAYSAKMMLGGIMLLVAALVGGIPYIASMVQERRLGALATMGVASLVLGLYFQPPLEGGGRLLQYAIDIATWTSASPNRAYYMSFTYLALLCVALVCWIVFVTPRQLRNIHERTSATAYTRLNRVFSRLVMWTATFTLGLWLVMLHDVLDRNSPVTWYVLLQTWVPAICTVWCGIGMVLAVEAEGTRVNGWVSVYVFGGVLLFANLGPGLSVFERLLATSAMVLGLCAIEGSKSLRSLRAEGAPREEVDGSFRAMMVCGSIEVLLCALVWLLCPVKDHIYPTVLLFILGAMLFSIFRSITIHRTASLA